MLCILALDVFCAVFLLMRFLMSVNVAVDVCLRMSCDAGLHVECLLILDVCLSLAVAVFVCLSYDSVLLCCCIVVLILN